MKTDEEWNNHWNIAHFHFVKLDRINGTKERNTKMADYAEELILRAKEHYYSGDDIMSDNAFDKLERNLKLLRPDSPVLEKVGS